MPMTLTALLLATASLIAGGRYEGVCAQGRVSLHLGTDGTARYGDAEFTWQLTDDQLMLRSAVGDTLTLQIGEGPAGTITLSGPPFEQVWLTPVALPAERSMAGQAAEAVDEKHRPTALISHWLHRASGGSVTLELNPSGRFRMIQRFHSPVKGAEGPPRTTTGDWWSDAAGTELTLGPDGGPTLRYQVSRRAKVLSIRGGDLPTRVTFEHMGDKAPVGKGPKIGPAEENAR
ncbi:MAG: hypothetical protein ACE366_31235 [Bradymonadia bacterium]